MTIDDVVAHTVIGLAEGALFALAALGMVLVYRVTGVLNFAHGAMGMFTAFIGWQIFDASAPHSFALFGLNIPMPAHIHVALFGADVSVYFAALMALLFSLVMGFVLENAVFRWLAGRPQLVKATVTIGILLALQSAAAVIWGSNAYHTALKLVPSGAPTHIGRVPVTWNELLVAGVAVVLTVILALGLRYTRFGIAMRAVSDDPVAASLWGVPINLVGSVSWMLGSLVAGIAGILITQFVNFDPVSLTLLVLDALAAALIGGLVSLPLTLVGGLVVGLVESYPGLWVPSTGFPKFMALLLILAVLLLRPQRGLLAARD
ncbi:MAG: branched-chain amino acid ABC transporter permease [Candidatus Dormibacteria bacterium]